MSLRYCLARDRIKASSQLLSRELEMTGGGGGGRDEGVLLRGAAEKGVYIGRREGEKYQKFS